jgi:hypothetical protein
MSRALPITNLRYITEFASLRTNKLLKNTPGEGTGPTSIANYLESCRPRALTRRSEGFSTAC